MTKEELKKKCAEWQKILRLQDWNVEVRMSRMSEMSDRDNLAECEYNQAKHSAIIRIIEPADYKDPIPQDIEFLLVHELLHLHIAPFYDDEKIIEIERAINLIASGLVGLLRKVNEM